MKFEEKKFTGAINTKRRENVRYGTVSKYEMLQEYENESRKNEIRILKNNNNNSNNIEMAFGFFKYFSIAHKQRQRRDH